MKIGALGAMLVAATLVASCGSSDDDTPAATATTIDADSVTEAVAAVSALIPVCSSPSATKLAAVPGAVAPAEIVSLAKKFALIQSPQPSILALSSVPPADMMGDCGGRLTFPASSYSHSNGVTTATLALENYCTLNTDTNTRLVLNGNLALVDNGTPSASGPITNWISADSPAGVTIATQDAAGQPIDSTLVSFSNFRYTVGVPGGDPTAASPDRFTLGELKTTTQSTGKTYRASGFSAEMFATPSGGEQFTVSGRGYRSNGEYFDVTTSVPLVLDATGNPTAGAITFSGANGSNAVATLMPGAVLQATMTLNGTPLVLPGMPACQ